ncbi:MAG: hypothetical protein COS99_04530 [Candidatus Omnitrophica bacterium CG07_land_8_20_14_0_80_42_15]|uniref:diguanylate cyclase n=1 Tax=Candidatus Aquitaenariimonas noxiae TaxID=1974741 RepID=A0A2J0L0G8_9BACT|nr:MAG: hypothetical protein COS99_04530 [Candidatus Omnitrophica bacterium CG07_land_8_20_14_0_80_42_15]
MKKILKKLSLAPKGLRYKLMIAFALTSVMPLLVAVYLAVNYVFPYIGHSDEIATVILLTILIAFLGMVFTRRLVEPIIDMALEAKIISSGDLNRKIKVDQGDEIGELGNTINDMTKRIKANLEELSSYGERTRQINMDIHQKVMALSNLLHIGDAITTAAMPLDNILNLISEKVAQTYDTGYTVLFIWEDETEKGMSVKTQYNIPTELLKNINIKKGEDLFDKFTSAQKIWSGAKQSKLPGDVKMFLDAYGLKNLVTLPIVSRDKLVGLLMIGNQLDNFEYKKDDMELYTVFVRQVAIAIENDNLYRKTKELAITDDLTGLYNKRYITSRLEEEIKRSILFQRPCSFAIIDVDDFNKMKSTYDGILIERAMKKIAEILQGNTTEIGKAARFGPNQFALLLPEANKKRAADVAEDIRRKVETVFSKRTSPEDIERLTVSIGISENPIDGANANELIEKAEKAVNVAKSLGKNKVVAHIGG